MKKLLLLIVIAAKMNSISAQDYDTIPPYQKDSLHLPDFTVLQLDSTYTNNKKIPDNKPVVIIYFSPECGHCQITAEDFGKNMKELKDYFFVWVAYRYPLWEIKDFAKKFNLQQFNNTIIGKDPNYTIPAYFRVRFTPFIAVYNKQHHLVETYPKGTEAGTLISLLKDKKLTE